MDKLLSKYATTFAISVLVISSLLIGAIVYQVSITKKRLAIQLISQSIEQTKSEINTFFNPVPHLILSEKNKLEWQIGRELSSKELNHRFIPIIKNHPQISSVGIADERGYEHNIIPDTMKNKWLNRMIFIEKWGWIEKWQQWTVTDSLILTDTWKRKASVDPKDRPWFKGAMKKDGELFWTKPYQYTTDLQFGITASIQYQKVINTDTLTKILAFDLTLKDIDKLVEDLKLTKNQNVFLLSEDNKRVISKHHATSESNVDQTQEELPYLNEGIKNSELIEVIKESNNHVPFEFEINGEDWWGIVSPYYITSSQIFNIVTILPEKDFSEEINRTQWIIIISFLLILILTVIIVANHNNLHRISNILSEKNALIYEQKEFLFSEVHHRVKNNLALINAFLELDLIKSTNIEVDKLLSINNQRIKVIALVQEEAYQAKELANILIDNLVNRIIKSLQRGSEANIEFNLQTNNSAINVNQAQSYGLLLNELLIPWISQNDKALPKLSINIVKRNDRLITHIIIESIKTKEEFNNTINKDLINALLSQLGAKHKTSTNGEFNYYFDFKLSDKKGTVVNRYYPK